jgi:hypothetical protein
MPRLSDFLARPAAPAGAAGPGGAAASPAPAVPPLPPAAAARAATGATAAPMAPVALMPAAGAPAAAPVAGASALDAARLQQLHARRCGGPADPCRAPLARIQDGCIPHAPPVSALLTRPPAARPPPKRGARSLRDHGPRVFRHPDGSLRPERPPPQPFAVVRAGTHGMGCLLACWPAGLLACWLACDACQRAPVSGNSTRGPPARPPGQPPPLGAARGALPCGGAPGGDARAARGGARGRRCVRARPHCGAGAGLGRSCARGRTLLARRAQRPSVPCRSPPSNCCPQRPAARDGRRRRLAGLRAGAGRPPGGRPGPPCVGRRVGTRRGGGCARQGVGGGGVGWA